MTEKQLTSLFWEIAGIMKYKKFIKHLILYDYYECSRSAGFYWGGYDDETKDCFIFINRDNLNDPLEFNKLVIIHELLHVEFSGHGGVHRKKFEYWIKKLDNYKFKSLKVKK